MGWGCAVTAPAAQLAIGSQATLRHLDPIHVYGSAHVHSQIIEGKGGGQALPPVLSTAKTSAECPGHASA